MPKVPRYTLAFSPATEAYELYQTPDRSTLGIVPESPAWFAWLEKVPSFAFVGKNGHYTARKEARQRVNRYWYAYLTTGGQLSKRYLGKASDLTLARLEKIAGMLHAQREKQHIPPPISLAATVNGKVVAAQQPLLVGQQTPFHPLLATKLHIPRPRTHLVPRAHLVQRLQRGVERALTLVSAPAGFGKTTLLAQWLAESDTPVAWLSLDAEDNDPTRFLSYLIAALQTLDGQIGTTTLEILHTQQPAPPETVLAVLISELTSRDTGDFALVLDDYHAITAEPIQHGLTFLLEHLPPQLHFVLATRADPPLPLARLRAQGQLTEVRTADLRFGTIEAGTFLQAVMGLDLEAEAIVTLEQRTEGWIAGLQLAALSLQGRADVSAFLAAFTGSHRFVLDYLSDEVLRRQTEPVQQFLLHTCILERMSGPLCDAVTQQEGSQAMLEALERINLFVVALDDERGWYRYHHLFAEVLHTHLRQREPTLPPILHRRASAWYEQHELPAEAVQHALAVPDAELAARLIEPIGAYLIERHGQISTVLGWMKALPDALVGTRPLLCVYHAVLLMYTNELEAAEVRMQEAEHGLKEHSSEQARIILGIILSIRATISLSSDDIPRAISLAQQALALLPEEEAIPRASAQVTTLRAYQVSGEVTYDTEHGVEATVASIRTSEHLIATVISICLLAHLHVLQGRLRQAEATYAQVVQAVPLPGVLQNLFSSRYYYFGRGDLLREWNDLEAAERYLAQGMALENEKLRVEPFLASLGYTALARLLQARGNTTAALATLDTWVHLAGRQHYAIHQLTKVAAVRAQLELAQGNVAAAIRWADSSGLSTGDDDLRYPRESEYLILARVRIAQGSEAGASPFLQEVLHLLDRLQVSAEANARLGSVLEILVVPPFAFD
jgi:LuxR family maltose regulon positive regulatory protein